MCGICGIATQGARPDRDLILRMCETIRHRGPDGDGFYVADGIGLGMRRLAVIDLQTGWQPMSNETGRVQVVFNGEIYNYRELRHFLQQKGHYFHTNSDTEVIPHLYEEYGLDFLDQLNGIFAIALWDVDVQRLLLTRDRMGVKPLFYSVRDGSFYFGSEVKCILAAGGSSKEIDVYGLDQFLTFEYTASPWTLFRDVKKLAPGSWITWQKGEICSGAFWRITREQEALSLPEDEWASRLKDIFNRSVKRQMVSDVPLGGFLSGGIDSSILISAMSHASNQPVKTFSIGFNNETYNELPFARQMAQHCQTEHYEAILEPRYLSMVDEVIEHMDQPISDFSVFPTLLVSRMAREKVTVALSGDGGDELFSGYDAYVADKMAQRSTDHLPTSLRRMLLSLSECIPLSEAKKGIRNNVRRFLEGAGLPSEWQHMRWMTFLSPDQKRELYLPEVHVKVASQTGEIILDYLDNPGEDRLQRQLFCDARFYLAEDIMSKVDLMSMATSLETRVPYLDNEVVDFVISMPSYLKWKGKERKYLLKRAYALDLPSAILRRKKEGFSIPLKAWLNAEWNSLMHELLDESEIKRSGLINPGTVNRLVHEHETNHANHSHILWGLMVFQLWQDKFLKSDHWNLANSLSCHSVRPS